jgi:hypothetical protein
MELLLSFLPPPETVMTMLVGVTGLVCAGLLFYLFLSL